MGIKSKDISDLPVDDLLQKLAETKEELFNLRFQNATGQLDNYSRLAELKRDVARLRTVLREREIEAAERDVPADEADNGSRRGGARTSRGGAESGKTSDEA
jgi:large subunit ribosomal protein L29